MNKTGALIVAVSSTFVSVFGFNAVAHEAATGIVKHRMINMKSMGNAMKGITVMMRQNTSYDPGRARFHAQTIERLAGHALTDLFPQGSLQEPTDAVPAIWTEWQEFTKLASQLRIDAAQLKASVDKDVNSRTAALANLGKTCSACHRSFRKKK